ncbi:MAG: nickel pincer cofactor biosynthesis protein LarC [Pirellulales bacterium]
MKIAYLDCASGISGDMTLGALVDAGVELATIQAGIDSLGLPDCRLVADEVKKNGFRAMQITVEHQAEHEHRHLHQITEMIDGSVLTGRQKNLAKNIFTRLGRAEAKVHGTTIEQVHFHEVGAVDSIADIVGSAIGWDLLGVEQIVSSAIPTGNGFVEIAHGGCSVPAPATAELLTGVPTAASTVEAELTTPTGAAIIAVLASDFGPLPAMTIETIGYGAGRRDLEEQANLLRLLVGESASGPSDETIWVLETNIDDATGEVIGHCTKLLLETGALDVYTTAIHMKKNRPGVLITVLCQKSDVGRLQELLLRETTTLGVRRWPADRTTLRREPHEVQTPWGFVCGVIAWRTAGQVTFSPEYESCRNLAEQSGVTISAVFDAARKGFNPTA